MHIKLIKNAEVYAPEHMGKMDILLAGGKIAGVDKDLSDWGRMDGVETIDCRGMKALPGMIDAHAHIAGGGGEGGFYTRTPEIKASEIISAGITTVVGCLGTDGICRRMKNLIAKAKELREVGISAYAYTGSYQVPVKTITGDIESDIALIEEIIGVGEIAVSDHRSSQPAAHELARLASEAHLGGMISGKAGIVNLHMGDGKEGFSIINEVLEKTDLPISVFYPTHANRSEKVFGEAVDYALSGGFVDMTTSTTDYFIRMGEVPCAKGLRRMLDMGVPIDRITFTSDAQGSLPAFDENGNFKEMGTGKPSSLLEAIASAVKDEGVPLETAARVATSNPARILKLKGKGEIKKGFDADILIVGGNDLSVKKVISKGDVLLQN